MVFMPMGYVIDKSEKAKFDRNKSKKGYLPKDVPLLESFRILKDGKPVTGLPLDPEHYRNFIDWLANGPPQPVPPVALRILCHYKTVVEDAKDDINTTDGMRLKQDNLIKTIEELIKGGDDNKDADAMCLTGGAAGQGAPATSDCCEEIKPVIGEMNEKLDELGTKAELDEIKTTMGTKAELDAIKAVLEELKTHPSTFDLKAELLKILNAAPAAAAPVAAAPVAAAPVAAAPGAADPALLAKIDEILTKLGGNTNAHGAIGTKLEELEAVLTAIGGKLNSIKPPIPGPDPLDPAFQALVTTKLTKIEADLDGLKQPVADLALLKGIMEKGFADLSGAIHSIGNKGGKDGADGADGEEGEEGAAGAVGPVGPAGPVKKINLAGIHALLTEKFTELDKILAIFKPAAEGNADTKLEGFLKAKFKEISDAIERINIVVPKPDFTELEAHIKAMFADLATKLKGQSNGNDSVTEIRTLITELKGKNGITAEDLAKLDGLLKNLPKPAGDMSPALEEIKELIKGIVIPPIPPIPPIPAPVIDFTELKEFITKLKAQKSLSDEDLAAIDDLIKKIGPGKDYEEQLRQIIESIRTPGGGVITEVGKLLDQLKTVPSLKQEDKDAIKALLNELPQPLDITEKLLAIEAAIKEIKPVDLEGIKEALEALKTQASLKEDDKTAIEEIIARLIKNPNDYTAILNELKGTLAEIKADPSLKEADLAAIRDLLKVIPVPVDYMQILSEIKALVEGLNMTEIKTALQEIVAAKPLKEEDIIKILHENYLDTGFLGLQSDVKGLEENVSNLKTELETANKNILALLARKAPKANLEDRAAEAIAKMEKAERAASDALKRLKEFDVAGSSPNAMEEISVEAKKQQARAELYKEEAEELFHQANIINSAEAAQVEEPAQVIVPQPPPGNQRGGASAAAARQLREAKASSAEGVIRNLGEQLVAFNLQLKEKRKSPKPEDCGPLRERIAELEATLREKLNELEALRKALEGKGGDAIANLERANLLLAEVAKLKATLKKVTGEVPDADLDKAVNAHLQGDEGLKTTIKKVTGEVADADLDKAVNAHLQGDEGLKSTIKKVVGQVNVAEFDPKVEAHMRKHHGLKKTIKKVTGEVANAEMDAKVTEHMLEYKSLQDKLAALTAQLAGLPDTADLHLRLQKEIAKAAELEALVGSGESATAELGSMRARVAALEAEIAALRAKHEEDKKTIASLTEQLRILTARCAAKEGEEKGLAKELADKTAELVQLRIQISQLTSDSEAKRRLEAELRDCRAKVDELTREVARLNGIIDSLRAELRSVQTELAAAKAKPPYQAPLPAYQPPYQAPTPPYEAPTPPYQAPLPPYQAPAPVQNDRWARNMHGPGDKKQNKPIPSYMRTTESRKSAIQASTNQLSGLGSSRVGHGVNNYRATKKQPVVRAVDSRPAWKRGGATKKGARLRKIKESINPM